MDMLNHDILHFQGQSIRCTDVKSVITCGMAYHSSVWGGTNYSPVSQEMEGVLTQAKGLGWNGEKRGAPSFPLQQHILIDIIYILKGFRL